MESSSEEEFGGSGLVGYTPPGESLKFLKSPKKWSRKRNPKGFWEIGGQVEYKRPKGWTREELESLTLSEMDAFRDAAEENNKYELANFWRKASMMYRGRSLPVPPAPSKPRSSALKYPLITSPEVVKEKKAKVKTLKKKLKKTKEAAGGVETPKVKKIKKEVKKAEKVVEAAKEAPKAKAKKVKVKTRPKAKAKKAAKVSPLWSQKAVHKRVPPEGKRKKTNSTQPQMGVIGGTYGIQGTKVVKKIGNEPESIKPLRDASKTQLKARRKGGEEKYKKWSLTDFYANGYARIPWAKIESVKGLALKDKIVPKKQASLKTPQAYWDAGRNIPWKKLYPNKDAKEIAKKIRKFRKDHPKRK